MPEPVWIDREVVLAIHDEQLAEHGGQSGVRDMGLLESALGRPRNRHAYAKGSIAELAASYAAGLSRDHPFIDGNKRTSLVVAELFLEMNGKVLTASHDACVLAFVELAAGTVSEGQLAEWIAAHSRSAK